ncbi:peptidoglycan DD-metalloendopeptidase family protein [Gaetbulibacter saemankumensis]|uniref:peptidoglycan DD-metalloendopeptidase family protein n=1 Tax=Gaetbulibacter saemankumensis TaxID=311208 RepID=UPI000417AE7B|nr:peptidoglycan DD-metalloendopeptidase family protein [Gaetbulibacter saemankumensis]
MQSILFSDVLKSICSEPLEVLSIDHTGDNFVYIDLSKTNSDLDAVDVSSSEKFHKYIEAYLRTNKADVAYGGYLETRSIYKRSIHFNKQDVATERNIHLGIDLWCQDGTGVLAVLEGIVHSIKNNTNYGDYGPTIILKHHYQDVIFYTLYGHLSIESINTLKVGDSVTQGQCIGYLGTSQVNGDYPPHLHFQVIKDLQGLEGDYPGVCNKKDVDFYALNCPNPNILLKI